MFNILQQIIKVILRHFPNVKNSDQPMKSFDEVSDDIQMRVRKKNPKLKFYFLLNYLGKSIKISFTFS